MECVGILFTLDSESKFSVNPCVELIFRLAVNFTVDASHSHSDDIYL